MARAIAEGLERVDPEGAAHYRDGRARFVALLDQKLAEWELLARPLRGVKAVTYHQDLSYLASRYGLQLVGTIEVKPGVPPTSGHIEELLGTMQREQVRLIVREVAYDPGLARTLAQRTGARIATISVLAGGLGREGYLDSIEANLTALVEAVGEGGPD
jgi:ABC-type Zn uptake system ZnuABC Zn-binding protein ZnuA